MRRKTQRLRPYFHEGHMVQLKPNERLLTRKYLEGLHGTILRIEQRPDPNFLELETQEDQEYFLRNRWVLFWVKLDDFPELDGNYRQHEVVFRYHELQPLLPRMSKQQLVRYCKERFVKEQNEHRRDAYLQMMLYLDDGRRPRWPLSSLDRCVVPEGYDVDLINRFISAAAQIRKLAQETREGNSTNELAEIYEDQAQVCDELRERLLPKKRTLAHLA
jgi:hypothetical protein